MRHALAILSILFLPRLSYAAAVQWGAFESSAPDPYHYGGVLVHSTICTTPPLIDVSFYVLTGWDQYNPSKTFIASDPNTDRRGSAADIQTYVSGAWLSADAGEIVNADSMLGKNHYFFNETFGSIHPEHKTPQWPEQEIGETAYLKVVIQDHNEVVDYINGRAPDVPSLYYGWVEYVVDEDGTFKILNSAIDLDGGSMIVGAGALPEPTSWLLLLLGTATLALRRKRQAQGH